jgi:hypothetical protein
VALQFPDDVRNAMCLACQSDSSTNAATLDIYSGSPPANTASAPTGTLLARCVLPVPCFTVPVGGSYAKSGTWQDISADASGTAGYFRFVNFGGTCFAQGTVTATGGGGDMTVDTVSFTAGAVFTVTACTFVAGGA